MPKIAFKGIVNLLNNEDDINSASKANPLPITKLYGINCLWLLERIIDLAIWGAIIPIKTIGPQKAVTVPDNNETNTKIIIWFFYI